MAQQPQQQQGSSDNSMAPVWITVLIFVVAYGIWYAGHQYIVAFIFKITVWQGQLINFFINNKNLQNNIYLMQTIDPVKVNWDQFIVLLRSVGDYVRYPVIGALIFLAIFLYRSNVTLRFRKTHTMQTLRQQEQYNWPAIMPITKENLVEADVNKGPWAMALTPMEFARKYELLRKDDAILDNQLPGLEMTAGIRKGDAKRVFTLQLGPYWDGFERAPAHVKALAAIFMARINRDRSAAMTIMETLDKTSIEGKPDFSFAFSTLKKYYNTELVQPILGSHAYLLTIMASLIEAAREDGVVPTSEILWLKPIDRRLWYMLNCVGRQTPYSEVAGPFAHWKAEKAMGRRSLVPMIDEAIKALENAVKEVKLSPRELQELKP